jgi:hypothetical protein
VFFKLLGVQIAFAFKFKLRFAAGVRGEIKGGKAQG